MDMYLREAAIALPSAEWRRPKPMKIYIGTAVSRVDGRAKVTGAAKYAGEFNVPRPGSWLRSHIDHTEKVASSAIDATEALRVAGVIDVLSHLHRPPMADLDSAYNDDAAPEGSPYRPLYDERILFNGQPVALVLADEWEIARFAASLGTRRI